jgi:hypothetical protein
MKWPDDSSYRDCSCRPSVTGHAEDGAKVVRDRDAGRHNARCARRAYVRVVAATEFAPCRTMPSITGLPEFVHRPEF